MEPARTGGQHSFDARVAEDRVVSTVVGTGGRCPVCITLKEVSALWGEAEEKILRALVVHALRYRISSMLIGPARQIRGVHMRSDCDCIERAVLVLLQQAEK